MKNYREIADSVFERRDRYVAEQKRKKQRILRTSASLGCFALVTLAGVGLVYSGVFDQTTPVTDGTAVTTTTVGVPTEGEDTTTTTTTTANTTDTKDTTTDGGIVTPPTTVTTVAPTTTAPAPSKTEPPKTTTTTGTKDKLLITGVEVDDKYVGDDAGGIFKPGEKSPLLEQAMEQYKDTNAVYAVLIAINPKYNQKLVDDLNEAVDALLQSDEMVKLAEQRDLAYEAWQAIDEERKANIGNEEWATKFLADCVAKKETYRSLWSQYENRQHDFKLAYWTARADEAVEVLAKFSDVELIPLDERYNEVSEKEEKAFLSYVLNAGYNTRKANGWPAYYGYAAILSADEILELSECGSYMFWLDSYDEEAYIDYAVDEEAYIDYAVDL